MLELKHIFYSFTFFLSFWEGRKLVQKALNLSWTLDWICKVAAPSIEQQFNILPVHELGSSSDRWCNDALFLWTAVCGDCSHQREVDLHSKHAHVPWMTFNCVEGCQANIMILFSIFNWIQLRPIVRDPKRAFWSKLRQMQAGWQVKCITLNGTCTPGHNVS